MLTRLHFKNWRSLKDAEINFTTPITVFIGANSSGKTNILDGLHFLRDMMRGRTREAAYYQWERRNARTIGVSPEIPMSLALRFSSADGNVIGYRLQIKSHETPVEIEDSLAIIVDDKELPLSLFTSAAIDGPFLLPQLASIKHGNGETIDRKVNIQEFTHYVSDRWQLLDENFMPPRSIRTDQDDPFYPYIVDQHATNVAAVLSFISEKYPSLYAQLQDDLIWLLGHIKAVETERTERETRLFVREKSTRGEAPTVSLGTLRIIAMLLPFYALDMRYPELPGLVVIEEPDTALNPWLLKNFVEQLRNYTEQEGKPRQVILTTHNPMFLNYFQPEEVRVVERDEQGYTHVNTIPDYIKDIWLKDGEYGLGEVWTTNSFGGLPK